MSRINPHASEAVLHAGASLESARGVLVMLHGRGASAESILSLFAELNVVSGLAAVAPQAAGGTWYPHSFLAPLAMNQPFLDAALSTVESVVSAVLARGIPGERIAILGFSQGACLAAEFAARHPRHYGAVMALTGGLIGPDGTPREYPGSLAGTAAFLGTSDPDPHVPLARVEETRDVFQRMGATVELRRYPGMPHTMNEDEVDACRELLRLMLEEKRG
jgi:predicted esterase